LETDDFAGLATRLHLVFAKGLTLPLEKAVTVQASRTVIKGSGDSLSINVYYGPHEAAPAANQCIGRLVIHGAEITRDIVKGSDIELTIRDNESQHIGVSAYVTMSGQTFGAVFEPGTRAVTLDSVREDLLQLDQEIASARKELESEESPENTRVVELHGQVRDLQARAQKVGGDDVSSERYQLDDRKRELYQQWTALSTPRRCAQLRNAYQELKQEVQTNVAKNGNDQDKKAMADLLSREDSVMLSTNPLRIQQAIEELRMLNGSILWRTPGFLIGLLNWVSERRNLLNDGDQARTLLDAGRLAIANADYDRLGYVDSKLVELLPNAEQEQVRHGAGVGITL
jgi:molecular chaperone DnaK